MPILCLEVAISLGKVTLSAGETVLISQSLFSGQEVDFMRQETTETAYFVPGSTVDEVETFSSDLKLANSKMIEPVFVLYSQYSIEIWELSLLSLTLVGNITSDVAIQGLEYQFDGKTCYLVYWTAPEPEYQFFLSNNISQTSHLLQGLQIPSNCLLSKVLFHDSKLGVSLKNCPSSPLQTYSLDLSTATVSLQTSAVPLLPSTEALLDIDANPSLILLGNKGIYIQRDLFVELIVRLSEPYWSLTAIEKAFMLENDREFMYIWSGEAYHFSKDKGRMVFSALQEEFNRLLGLWTDKEGKTWVVTATPHMQQIRKILEIHVNNRLQGFQFIGTSTEISLIIWQKGEISIFSLHISEDHMAFPALEKSYNASVCAKTFDPFEGSKCQEVNVEAMAEKEQSGPLYREMYKLSTISREIRVTLGAADTKVRHFIDFSALFSGENMHYSVNFPDLPDFVSPKLYPSYEFSPISTLFPLFPSSLTNPTFYCYHFPTNTFYFRSDQSLIQLQPDNPSSLLQESLGKEGISGCLGDGKEVFFYSLYEEQTILYLSHNHPFEPELWLKLPHKMTNLKNNRRHVFAEMAQGVVFFGEKEGEIELLWARNGELVDYRVEERQVVVVIPGKVILYRAKKGKYEEFATFQVSKGTKTALIAENRLITLDSSLQFHHLSSLPSPIPLKSVPLASPCVYQSLLAASGSLYLHCGLQIQRVDIEAPQHNSLLERYLVAWERLVKGERGVFLVGIAGEFVNVTEMGGVVGKGREIELDLKRVCREVEVKVGIEAKCESGDLLMQEIVINVTNIGAFAALKQQNGISAAQGDKIPLQSLFAGADLHYLLSHVHTNLSDPLTSSLSEVCELPCTSSVYSFSPEGKILLCYSLWETKLMEIGGEREGKCGVKSALKLDLGLLMVKKVEIIGTNGVKVGIFVQGPGEVEKGVIEGLGVVVLVDLKQKQVQKYKFASDSKGFLVLSRAQDTTEFLHYGQNMHFFTLNWTSADNWLKKTAFLPIPANSSLISASSVQTSSGKVLFCLTSAFSVLQFRLKPKITQLQTLFFPIFSPDMVPHCLVNQRLFATFGNFLLVYPLSLMSQPQRVLLPCSGVKIQPYSDLLGFTCIYPGNSLSFLIDITSESDLSISHTFPRLSSFQIHPSSLIGKLPNRKFLVLFQRNTPYLEVQRDYVWDSEWKIEAWNERSRVEVKVVIQGRDWLAWTAGLVVGMGMVVCWKQCRGRRGLDNEVEMQSFTE